MTKFKAKEKFELTVVNGKDNKRTINLEEDYFTVPNTHLRDSYCGMNNTIFRITP